MTIRKPAEAVLWLATLGALLAACAPQGVPTFEFTEQVTTVPPSPVPQATLLPTQPVPSPTSTPFLEAHTVELEWPPRMRLGESDILRLALFPTDEGLTVKAEFPEHEVESESVPVERLPGYSLSAVAHLDAVGFLISPQGEQARSLPPGEGVSWRWSLTPKNPGQQRISIQLFLHWEPMPDTAGRAWETVIYSRGIDVRVTSLLGLTQGEAMTTGLLGLLFGGGLSLTALILRERPTASPLRYARPDRSLKIEPDPSLKLGQEEIGLMQSLFRRYDRLVLEEEFLSGYSGARTFLAQPIRGDGRTDAHTIVKIGPREAIRREFENYEAFVKDTLPPVTARIQHPPVMVRGGLHAALRYTFLGEPGSTPTSLRQVLLNAPEPAYLHQLFEIFGPNWWMQRRPYIFRLGQEYDRMLPTHYVLRPTSGRGTVLDGKMAPGELQFSVGDQVTLRGFPRVSLRADGKSYSLSGVASPGQPALRVRWLGRQTPGTGRIVATRRTLLQGFISGFERHGLPDPLESLAILLNETVTGTQSTIHGDLNLENVLVGPGKIVWLIDFAQTRDGHALFDFAHLEAEVIAQVLAAQVSSPREFLDLLQSESHPLLVALREIAGRCLFDRAQPREYELALYMACIGALKFENLAPQQKQLLYLTAAFLAQSL